MDNCMEVKNFIANFHPEIEIENIEFEYINSKGGDGRFQDCACFMTEEACNLYNNSEEKVDGVCATFHLRDHGAKMSQKDIQFRGRFEICDNLTLDPSLRCQVPVCEIHPECTFEAMADLDGRFSVSVPVIFRKSPDTDAEKLFLDLKRRNAFFSFRYIVIANQFVAEKIEYINGRIPQLGKKTEFWMTRTMYTMSGISSINNQWVQFPDDEKSNMKKCKDEEA